MSSKNCNEDGVKKTALERAVAADEVSYELSEKRFDSNHIHNNFLYFMGRDIDPEKQYTTYDMSLHLGSTWVRTRMIQTGEVKATQEEMLIITNLLGCSEKELYQKPIVKKDKNLISRKVKRISFAI